MDTDFTVTLSLSLSQRTLRALQVYVGTEEFTKLKKADRKDIQIFITYLEQCLGRAQPVAVEAETLV